MENMIFDLDFLCIELIFRMIITQGLGYLVFCSIYVAAQEFYV